jgi:hypothetical protein
MDLNHTDLMVQNLDLDIMVQGIMDQNLTDQDIDLGIMDQNMSLSMDHIDFNSFTLQ